MEPKVLIIISSADREKIWTGLLYAQAAITSDWMGFVKIFLWGPSEEVIAKDIELQEDIKNIIEYAAITHGHPSGYLPAGFLSEMICYLVEGKTLAETIDLSIKRLITYNGYSETLSKIELARELSVNRKSVEESIQTIGRGWVGEETIAISVYCALKFSDDWKRGILAAVNHSGDSDSTGSITGAILGIYLVLNQFQAIGSKMWRSQIESRK